MKFLIILLLTLCYLPQIFAKAVQTCAAPDKLEELDFNMETKLTQAEAKAEFKVKETDRQTQQYRNLMSQKFFRTREIIAKKFPNNYKNIFYHYKDNFDQFDRLYARALEDDMELAAEMQDDWEYNHYVFSDIFPILLADSEMITLRMIAPSKNLEIESQPFWDEMLHGELDTLNLKICREQENKLNGETALSELKSQQFDLPYRWTLQNPDTKSYSGTFNPNIYDALAVNTELGGNEDFISDPSSKKLTEEIDDEFAIWAWIKNTFGNLNLKEDKLPGIEERTLSQELEEFNLTQNLNFIENRDKNLQIKRRYVDWRNNRNYWISKTRDTDGYNLDVMVEKFEIMLDAILRINDELELSLHAIEKVCQRQNILIKCWKTGGNNIPWHPTTIPKSYEHRSARER